MYELVRGPCKARVQNLKKKIFTKNGERQYQDTVVQEQSNGRQKKLLVQYNNSNERGNNFLRQSVGLVLKMWATLNQTETSCDSHPFSSYVL